jgi:nucleotide-binding universal stress UspA family protein
MLFTSGRPVIVIPPFWEKGAGFGNVMVAWDGSARAARAVGDALPLLTRAQRVEILCVSSEELETHAGQDLAVHLARHCAKVSVSRLHADHRDVAKTLRDHATTVEADFFVMGAYAHSQLLETVLGGVTQEMLSNAELPVLFSY